METDKKWQTTREYCHDRMLAWRVAMCIKGWLENADSIAERNAMWEMFIKKPKALLLLVENADGGSDILIHFRNKEYDKKGKLKRCEAYIVRKKKMILYTEINE